MLPAVLPLFPLSQVALFPHTFLPLHIFEPRYRQLVKDVLVSHQHFVLVLAKDSVTTDPTDRPSLHSVGSLARIVRAEPLSDGRWNLLVQGMGICRLEAEIQGNELYRQAKIQVLPFDHSKALDDHVRQKFLADLQQYARKHDMELPMSELLDLPLEDEARVCTLAMALEFDHVEKQFLLEAQDLPTMVDRLSQLLAFDLGGRGASEGMIH